MIVRKARMANEQISGRAPSEELEKKQAALLNQLGPDGLSSADLSCSLGKRIPKMDDSVLGPVFHSPNFREVRRRKCGKIFLL